ncbi:hypothetical protein TWF481_006565 [Arthrobotrys musiformis]|uniref:Uncharacterized protein n=1 Tax=Arthrobotrys musiformis TaxID=47236 RepID=A0AAV9WAU3_9PEZI
MCKLDPTYWHIGTLQLVSSPDSSTLPYTNVIRRSRTTKYGNTTQRVFGGVWWPKSLQDGFTQRCLREKAFTGTKWNYADLVNQTQHGFPNYARHGASIEGQDALLVCLVSYPDRTKSDRGCPNLLYLIEERHFATAAAFGLRDKYFEHPNCIHIQYIS